MENSLHAEYACVNQVIPQLLGDPRCQGSTSQVRKQVQKEGVTYLGHTLMSRGHPEAPGGWRGCSPLLCFSRAGGGEVAPQIREDLPVLYRMGWPVPCWPLWATWVRNRGRRSQAHTSGGMGSKAAISQFIGSPHLSGIVFRSGPHKFSVQRAL